MEHPFLSLTAADIMTRDLILVPQEMSLPGAARLLSRARVSGAPVVDADGRCVGVVSTTDFLHCVENGHAHSHHPEPTENVCSWQIFGSEAQPTDSVRQFMTGDLVVTMPGATVGEVAQMMLDARIHRVIVVDAMERPIGIVSTTDILAAVAREARAHVTTRRPSNEFEATVSG